MIYSEPQRKTPISGSAHGESESGPVPASLLLISAGGAPRPALLRALDRDGLCVQPGALPPSAATVDDADVVVIDATDSVAEGIDTLVSVRRQSGVPVVFVAGAGSGPQAVQALELGADDFAIEPFVRGEVPARVRSVLRRSRRPGRPVPLTFGRLAVFLAEREVRVDGRVVETTPLEFDLLARLVGAPRRVFSRTELLEQVWGSSGAWQSPATVTEHIRRLRLKLGRPGTSPLAPHRAGCWLPVRSMSAMASAPESARRAGVDLSDAETGVYKIVEEALTDVMRRAFIGPSEDRR